MHREVGELRHELVQEQDEGPFGHHRHQIGVVDEVAELVGHVAVVHVDATAPTFQHPSMASMNSARLWLWIPT